MSSYRLTQTGAEVQGLLDKVETLKIKNGTITIGEESLTPVTTETDPTVPSWAKEPTKPSYSLAELQDDATHRTVTDVEKATWNGKQDTLVSGTNIKTVNGENILGSGNIVAGDPNAVKYTEQTLTDAQKTQARTNIGAGTYSKPSEGIPSSDMGSAVRTSLGKADTAIQGYVVSSIANVEAYVAQELMFYLSQKPTMKVVKYANGTEVVRIHHPLMNYTGAEVVLMSYAKRNGKKLSNARARTKRKGFCIATPISGEPGHYFTFSAVTQLSDLLQFLDEFTPEHGDDPDRQRFRGRAFGIALRIPNPQYSGPVSLNKNNTFEGVPESLWSDVLRISANHDYNSTHVKGVGLI